MKIEETLPRGGRNVNLIEKDEESEAMLAAACCIHHTNILFESNSQPVSLYNSIWRPVCYWQLVARLPRLQGMPGDPRRAPVGKGGFYREICHEQGRWPQVWTPLEFGLRPEPLLTIRMHVVVHWSCPGSAELISGPHAPRTPPPCPPPQAQIWAVLAPTHGIQWCRIHIKILSQIWALKTKKVW